MEQLNIVREAGKKLLKNTPMESAAFRTYEWMLDRYVAGSPWPSGYYNVEIENTTSPPFIIWLEGKGPTDRAQIRGQYEPEVIKKLVTYVDPSMEFWEVGGGWGYHSLALAPVVDNVVAFEAEKQRAVQIRESAHRNQYENVEVVQGTVGTEISLDEFSCPDVVLLDVVGWEVEVLQRSPELLRSGPLWIVEIHEPGVQGVERGIDPEEVYNIFEQHGYEVGELSRRKPGNFHIVAKTPHS